MKEVNINEDIRNFKTKAFFGFTMKQFIGLIVAVGLCSFIKFGVKIPEDIETFAMLIAIIPPILFGFINPYGMSFANFLKHFFIDNVLQPSIRKYEIFNEFDKYAIKEDKLTAKEIKKRKKNMFINRTNDNPKLQGFK